MLSCKDVAELASKSLDTNLTFSQRLAMQIHLMMCKFCTNYVKSLKFLHNSMSSQDSKKIHEHCEDNLSTSARERIRQKLTKSN